MCVKPLRVFFCVCEMGSLPLSYLFVWKLFPCEMWCLSPRAWHVLCHVPCSSASLPVPPPFARASLFSFPLLLLSSCSSSRVHLRRPFALTLLPCLVAFVVACPCQVAFSSSWHRRGRLPSYFRCVPFVVRRSRRHPSCRRPVSRVRVPSFPSSSPPAPCCCQVAFLWCLSSCTCFEG
jgi:hypothetical protein